MHLLMGEQQEAGGKSAEIRGGNTQIGEVQGEAITYNDYFNDSSDEGSYVESSEEEDYVDSDFVTDDDEDEEEDADADDDIALQDRVERKKAKKAAYVDPAKRAAKAAKAAESDSDSDEGGKVGKGKREKGGKNSESCRPERSFRSSTTQRSEASKTAAQDAAQRRNEGGKARPKEEERRLTQAELLEEAKQTAVENEKDLQRLVRIEEDMKRVVWKKAPLTGPRIITLSRRDHFSVTFSDPAATPALNWEKNTAPAPPAKAVCAITGKPAKYRDPKTGQFYATLEAFKKLRASS